MPWLFDEQEIYQISERTLPNFVLYKRGTTAEEHGVNNLLDLNHGGGPLMSRICGVSEIYVWAIFHSHMHTQLNYQSWRQYDMKQISVTCE